MHIFNQIYYYLYYKYKKHFGSYSDKLYINRLENSFDYNEYCNKEKWFYTTVN